MARGKRLASGAGVKVSYDKDTGDLLAPPGHAVRIKIGQLEWGGTLLEELVPERATHIFALHPKKWVATFHSLTLKDPRKIVHYEPKAIPMVPGTLVADMKLANTFMITGNPEYAHKYARSVLPVEQADLDGYQMPELLIPRSAR